MTETKRLALHRMFMAHALTGLLLRKEDGDSYDCMEAVVEQADLLADSLVEVAANVEAMRKRKPAR